MRRASGQGQEYQGFGSGGGVYRAEGSYHYGRPVLQRSGDHFTLYVGDTFHGGRWIVTGGGVSEVPRISIAVQPQASVLLTQGGEK